MCEWDYFVKRVLTGSWELQCALCESEGYGSVFSATGLQHQLSSYVVLKTLFLCLKCHSFGILMPKFCSIRKIRLLEDFCIPKSFTK